MQDARDDGGLDQGSGGEKQDALQEEAAGEGEVSQGVAGPQSTGGARVEEGAEEEGEDGQEGLEPGAWVPSRLVASAEGEDDCVAYCDDQLTAIS